MEFNCNSSIWVNDQWFFVAPPGDSRNDENCWIPFVAFQVISGILASLYFIVTFMLLYKSVFLPVDKNKKVVLLMSGFFGLSLTILTGKAVFGYYTFPYINWGFAILGVVGIQLPSKEIVKTLTAKSIKMSTKIKRKMRDFKLDSKSTVRSKIANGFVILSGLFTFALCIALDLIPKQEVALRYQLYQLYCIGIMVLVVSMSGVFQIYVYAIINIIKDVKNSSVNTTTSSATQVTVYDDLLKKFNTQQRSMIITAIVSIGVHLIQIFVLPNYFLVLYVHAFNGLGSLYAVNNLYGKRALKKNYSSASSVNSSEVSSRVPTPKSRILKSIRFSGKQNTTDSEEHDMQVVVSTNV